MTVPSSSSRTVLVMSGDGARREGWASYFEEAGLRTIKCPGPRATPCLPLLGRRCPLHDVADFIFYDEESLTSELEARLRALPPKAPIAHVRGLVGEDGVESPIATRAFRRQRPRG